MSGETRVLKVIATMEACKGILSLVVGLGLHVLAGENLRHIAEQLVMHAHLNPASHYPSIFIHAASQLHDSQLNLVAFGAMGYALIRFVEAYGLWHAMLWTEWFALLSGAIYLPFELYEVIFHTSSIGIFTLAINIVVVAYMYYVVKRKPHKPAINEFN